MMSAQYLSAKKIVMHLQSNGYTTYFAGGWVRDYLLDQASDDIDIATSATPQEVRQLFHKTYAVGESFGVILVEQDGFYFEVATFRADLAYSNGRHPDRIDYSSPVEDAKRRDFTVNGLFYDPVNECIHDYVKGKQDIQNKSIRAIGEAKTRFTEDRLRMIRACRFAATLDFTIEKTTLLAVCECASTLFPAVSVERVWNELEKIHKHGALLRGVALLLTTKLFQEIFPLSKLQDVEELAAKVKLFPEQPFSTALLIPFFMNSIDQVLCLDTADHFKLSNAAKKCLRRFLHCIETYQNHGSKRDWAHIYAIEDFGVYLQLMAAWFVEEKIIQEHLAQARVLSHHVERIKTNTPLIRAEDLLQEGIKPGPRLGKLLDYAEELAIEQDLKDPNKLLSQLKMSSLWS